MFADREHLRPVGLIARDALHFLSESRAGEPPSGTFPQRKAYRLGVAEALRAKRSQRGFGRIVQTDME
jgi:hypothetical protein